MSAPETSNWTEGHQAALEHTWGECRVWAATSRRERAQIVAWRWRVLIMTIAGAVLGVTAGSLGRLDLQGVLAILPEAVGLLSGAALALATFFGREVLSPERERLWVRGRSMAEALKSETFLFRTAVPPYDGPDAAKRLLTSTRKLLEVVRETASANLTDAERCEGLPEGPLTVEGYITQRVDDQIDGFYRARARQYETLIKRARLVSLWLGAAATLLGLFSAIEWAAGWVAVLTTVTASIGSYVFAGHYQSQLIVYQTAAAELAALRTEWRLAGSQNPTAAQRADLIRACEEVMSIENSAWMSRWLEKPPENGQAERGTSASS